MFWLGSGKYSPFSHKKKLPPITQPSLVAPIVKSNLKKIAVIKREIQK